MKFNEDKPIYLQIADILTSRILSGDYLPDAKIPSIRETAVQLEVNPNTAARAFTFLQDHNIIYNRRGMGFFVNPDGKKQALQLKRNDFIKEQIPNLKKNMNLLGITQKELQKLLQSSNK